MCYVTAQHQSLVHKICVSERSELRAKFVVQPPGAFEAYLLILYTYLWKNKTDAGKVQIYWLHQLVWIKFCETNQKLDM